MVPLSHNIIVKCSVIFIVSDSSVWAYLDSDNDYLCETMLIDCTQDLELLAICLPVLYVGVTSMLAGHFELLRCGTVAV